MSDARSSLAALLDRVAQGEEITVTRHGRPAAVLVHPDSLRRRRTADLDRRVERLQGVFDIVRRERDLGATPAPIAKDDGWAEETVRSIREGRDAR